MTDKYEYHLKFWGQIQNEDHKWVEKELGITESDFWFDNKDKRANFKKKLQNIADKYNSCIVFAEHEGFDVRKRTIARMIMRLPDGREYPYSEDFGYGYSEESAEFMYFDGNYACDCNKSLLLSRVYSDVQESDCCGESIKLIDFKVEKV